MPPPRKTQAAGAKAWIMRGDAASQGGSCGVAQHLLPYQRHGRPAERQEIVVEAAPSLGPAARRGPVVAEFSDHQLAERVVEVARVVGAARGLLFRVAGILEGLLEEHLLAVRDLHPLRVHADRAEVADVSVE